MKRTLGILAVIASLCVLPGTAKAGHSNNVYISGYRSCGTPIYTERVLVGYDHYRRPVYQYRTVQYRTAPVYHGGYVRSDYRGERYDPRCEPPRYTPPRRDPRYDRGYQTYYPERSRTEVVISGPGGYLSYRR
jgi:hypothetical protein